MSARLSELALMVCLQQGTGEVGGWDDPAVAMEMANIVYAAETEPRTRPTWTTRTIRASDLVADDVVLIAGVWRAILDVWTPDGNDPEATFGEGSPLAKEIAKYTENPFELWVAARFIVEETSTATDLATRTQPYRMHDLVEVQERVVQ